MFHTTGQGVPSSVGWKGDKALDRAIQIYNNSGGPHYVIGWDGKIVATVRDENIRGAHAGVTSDIKPYYERGVWENKVSAQGVKLWKERWPGKNSPIDLIPTRNLGNINDLWIGVEMIPISGDGRTYYAPPAYPGARFTLAQHEAARNLADDIAKRHNFPSGWKSKSSTRLVGHSDLNPIERDSVSLPLWDPGSFGPVPQFSMEFVRGGNAGWLIAAGLALGLGFYLSKYV